MQDTRRAMTRSRQEIPPQALQHLRPTFLGIGALSHEMQPPWEVAQEVNALDK